MTVRSLVLELPRGELVRLDDRHDVVDAGRAVEVEVGDVLAVADRADHGQHLALGDVRACAPTDSTRSTTASICSFVAASFITIIICP